MSDDYEEFERAYERQRARNDAYLDEFEEWLRKTGLKDKTIQGHLQNVDFFINTYLLREDAYDIDEGCRRVDDFLGYFFIRKCMWSTPATIRRNAASLKKFYKCMLERGHVSKEDHDLLLATIKSEMPFWVEDCEKFNDPSYDYFGEEERELFGDIDDYFDETDGDDNDAAGGLGALLGKGAGEGGTSLFDTDLFKSVYNDVARSLGLGHLVSDEPDWDYELDEDELPTKEEAIEILTVALLYLCSRDAGQGDGTRVADNGLDPQAIQTLQNLGAIQINAGENTVALSQSCAAMAVEYLHIMGLGHLAEEGALGDDSEGEDAETPDSGPNLHLV